MKNKPTWKDVLNSDAPFARRWGDINEFLKIVNMVGYQYFSWNGRIYELYVAPLSCKDTGLTEDDLV